MTVQNATCPPESVLSDFALAFSTAVHSNADRVASEHGYNPNAWFFSQCQIGFEVGSWLALQRDDDVALADGVTVF